MIDNIVIDFWSSKNFANIENMKRKYNPNVDISKFASNKKILSGVVGLGFVWEFIREWNGMIIREWKWMEWS